MYEIGGPMRSERRRRAEVVGYWRAVELFCPPPLPSAPPNGSRGSTRERVQRVDVRPGEPWPPLPWQEGHPLADGRVDAGREVWRHTVYGGVFPPAAARGALGAHVGEDHSGVRGQRDETAVFALTVDADGVLLDGTAVLSTCAWATGRVRHPGPGSGAGWLDGFTATESACTGAIGRLSRHHMPYACVDDAPDGWRALLLDLLGSAAVDALDTLTGDTTAGTPRAGVPGQRVDEATSPRGEDARPRADALAVVPARDEIPPPRLARQGAAQADGPAAHRTAGVALAQSPALDVREGPARPLELPDLIAFAAHVADLCGVADLVSPTSIRVHSRRVRRRADGTLPDAEPALLNSPLAQDLERVAAADDHGAPLTAYLTAPQDVPVSARIDVRENPDVVLEAVAPGSTPLGRWPAPARQPLVLGQQFAVNTVLAELADGGGLFSVHGPPGTGATTMLRDLIAAVVVERATRLAALARPADGFAGRVEWRREGVARGVARLRPELTGHEIVVVSSDDGAARDITAELSAPAALGEEWHAEASYCAGQAVSLPGGAPVWGAVAAPLGDADERREFLDRWWRGERSEGDTDAPAPASLSPAPEPEPGWGAAKAEFLRAVRHARALRDDRASAARALRDLGRLDAGVADAEAAVVTARENEADASAALSAARAELRQATAAYENARERAERHRGNRPGGLRGALGTGRVFTEWQDGDRWLQGELNRAHLARGAALSEAMRAERARDEAAGLYRHARERLARAGEAVSDVRGRVARARTAWGAHVPEDHLTDAERELSSPWADEEFCSARTRVFLAALNLHRAFVAANARTVRLNLLPLEEVLAGAAPPDVALAVWQSLFLAVPVVSTTFASCGRLFGPLGAGSLGWVLADGAGQAVPQAAVGALWRARRAVLVGDPLQPEPVVPLSLSVRGRLREAYGVDGAWLPARTSAQAVADRVSVRGTTVRVRRPGEAAGAVWVGAPLRVHRRCERTMFELSNDIAYDGLLVYGTQERPFPGGRLCHACVGAGRDGCRDCVYPLSCWVDVLPGGAVGAWVPEEGVALERVLTLLHREWRVGLDRVRILSPFREVVSGCVRTVREMQLESSVPPGVPSDAHRRQVAAFLAEHIGTVRTVRGGASDVVVLVLGTHPRDGARARAWAAGSPNLLNGVVGRARRRLFVIGHQESWGAEPHFALLTRLPRHVWPASRAATGGGAVVSGVRYQ
ncbi:hypothetical protein IAG44_30315 [Streptomyces roseirectus]|uniref:DNA2/NAM7 helicase-like C-terminal domain-containing protein n=1 Tax=Streptomyces roseirectus TaxID=2768066 RepID=A0A7H0IKK0_9ACTN|nr:hypothetical protein [Streptomyces roseirectus]QNP73316.1 hypothetical protein IAG44_30315 [Streptomyces roseirectus]